jgi:hypothetical protein
MKLYMSVTAILLAVTVFVCPQKASAQFEVRAGIAGYPAVASSYYNDFGGSHYFDDYYSRSMRQMYGDYNGDSYSTGTISLEINYYLKNWLALSMDLGYNHIWSKRYNGVNDSYEGRQSANAFYVIPEIRFAYLHHPVVKLYSAVGTGVGIYDNFKELDSDVMPEIQLVPIGIMLGRKLFGFAELGFGTVYCGYKAGIGYRF